MKHILSFKVFEEGGGGGGVAAATGGNTSGMGAVVSPQASTIPGDVAGGTPGSGDIGSGWDPTVTRDQSNELKSGQKKKKKKKKKK